MASLPFPFNPTIAIFGLAALGVLLLVIWLWRLELRIKRLLKGKNAQSLEDSMVSLMGEIKDFKQFTRDMEEYLTTVEKRLKKSVQGVQTVRYNPFKGTGSGGNQSFSTAFINEKGDGVVLTSMYTRDRISMFAKPLKNFVSEFELSEEERESIEKSKQSLSF
jgi:hypothetical protein